MQLVSGFRDTGYLIPGFFFVFLKKKTIFVFFTLIFGDNFFIFNLSNLCLL